MSTIAANIPLEIKHVNNFRQHVNILKGRNQKDIDDYLLAGVMQSSTLFEHALADLGGHIVVSIHSNDLNHPIYGPSEAKLSSVRECGKKTKWSAPITGTYGKKGPIRAQVYDRRKDRFYYFVIPNSEYSKVPKTSNIEIPFELNGTPRKTPKGNFKFNWWKYEVETFDKLANKW